MVKLAGADERTCVLQWHQLSHNKGEGGELLASFELILVGSYDVYQVKYILEVRFIRSYYWWNPS